jgi:hypothetical protein
MNKLLITSIVSLFLVCSSSVFAQENSSLETSEHGTTALGIPLEILVTIAHWLTGLSTVVLTIALFMTFRHLEASTKMSKIETEYRLRPWIGPITGIKRMDNSINGDLQFSITIKNFGDLPANYVKAKSIVSTTPLTKESLKQPMSEFNLGPVLPHMEKSYLFFIKPDMWKKITDDNDSLYVALYFEYPSLTGSNGYGSVSEYNKTSQIFIHKDMWLDYPEIKLD